MSLNEKEAKATGSCTLETSYVASAVTHSSYISSEIQDVLQAELIYPATLTLPCGGAASID